MKYFLVTLILAMIALASATPARSSSATAAPEPMPSSPADECDLKPAKCYDCCQMYARCLAECKYYGGSEIECGTTCPRKSCSKKWQFCEDQCHMSWCTDSEYHGVAKGPDFQR